MDPISETSPQRSAQDVAVAVDESACSERAARWAARFLAGPRDVLHLVAVAPSLPQPGPMVSPLGASGAGAALGASLEQARHAGEEDTRALLSRVKSALPPAGASARCHLLPAAGGASGAGGALAAWVRGRRPAALVLGSRGLGTLSSALASAVGLGSVSSYCAHRAEAAVVVVPAGLAEEDGAAGGPRTLVVCLDGSSAAGAALDWALGSVLDPTRGDELHLVAVGPAGDADPLTDPDSPSARVLEVEAAEELRRDEAERCAEVLAAAAVAAAARGLAPARLRRASLRPGGGASGAAAALRAYANEHRAGLVVVGSRGMGGFRRALMAFVGLGSVSDDLAQHAPWPLAIVKAGVPLAPHVSPELE